MTNSPREAVVELLTCSASCRGRQFPEPHLQRRHFLSLAMAKAVVKICDMSTEMLDSAPPASQTSRFLSRTSSHALAGSRPFPPARSRPQRSRPCLHDVQHREGGGAGRPQRVREEGASSPRRKPRLLFFPLRLVFADSFLFAQYNGVWHCFVGRNFGAYMTHEAGHHVYFYVGQMAVLLFKTG